MTKENTSCVHFVVMFTNTLQIKLVTQSQAHVENQELSFLSQFCSNQNRRRCCDDRTIILEHCELQLPLFTVSIVIYLFVIDFALFRHHQKKDFLVERSGRLSGRSFW